MMLIVAPTLNSGAQLKFAAFSTVENTSVNTKTLNLQVISMIINDLFLTAPKHMLMLWLAIGRRNTAS